MLNNAATNTIAGTVRFSLDIRAPADAQRAAAVADIQAAIARIAVERDVRAQVSLTYEAPATPCDPHLTQLLADSVEGLGIRARRLPSGAGHDAMAFRGDPAAGHAVRALQGRHQPSSVRACVCGRYRRGGSRAGIFHCFLRIGIREEHVATCAHELIVLFVPSAFAEPTPPHGCGKCRIPAAFVPPLKWHAGCSLPRQDHHVRQVPALQVLRQRAGHPGVRAEGGLSRGG